MGFKGFVACLLFISVVCIDYQKIAENGKENLKAKGDDGVGRYGAVDLGPKYKSIKLTADHTIEVKLHIGAFTTECFNEYLKPGNVFHMIYHVIRGGDLTIQTTIMAPDNKLAFIDLSSTHHWYDNSDIQVEGEYKICLRNGYYSEKVVYINIITYSTEELKRRADEINEFEISNQAILDYFYVIYKNLDTIRVDQTLSRINENRDLYIIEENNLYVMYYSIAQVVVTFISGMVQVFFIKKLFSGNISHKLQQKA